MIPTSDPYTYIIALLQERTGQVFASNRHWRIEMVLKPIMRRYSIPDLPMLIELLESDSEPKLVSECIEALINNETCFFRDHANFALVGGPVIDALRKKRGQQNKRLRIWSAACSTGQEAYSLAITLAENAEKWRDWDVEIVATDVSGSALDKAKSGRYSQFEIQRGLPVTMMLKYFTQDGDDWNVDANLRQMIKFSKHNQLETASHMGKFDLILCRNMLMYLSGSNRQLALENLSLSLRSDGYLMLGAAETVLGPSELFHSSREFRGFYQAGKDARASSTTRLSA